MNGRLHHRLTSVALGTLALCLSGSASAEVFLGNDAALTAGTVGALTRDSEAVWYNPAGLGGSAKSKLDLSATAFVYRIREVENIIQVQVSSGTFPQDGSANELVSIPTTLVFTRNIDDQTSIGLGIYVPEVRDVIFKNSFASASERLTTVPYEFRGSYGIEYQEQLSRYHLGPAFGVELAPNLRIGAGLFAVYLARRVNSKLHAELSSLDAPEQLNIFYSTATFDRQSFVGFQATVGTQWDITESWHLGLVVRSPTVLLYRWGEQSAITTLGGFRGPPPVELAPDHHSIDVATRKISKTGFDRFDPLSLVPTLALSGAGYWVALATELRPPLTNPELGVDREAVWNLRLGAKLEIADDWFAGAGLYTDFADAPGITALGDDDVDFYGVTLGIDTKDIFGIQKVLEKADLQLSTIVGVGYAVGIGEVGGWLYDPVQNPGVGAVVERDALYHDISVHIGSSLQF